MHFFDSHTHLEHPRFDSDRPEIISRAKSLGVSRMATCGSDLVTSQQEVGLAKTYEGVFAAVGIHGHHATSAIADIESRGCHWELSDAAFRHLAELAAKPGVIAIGEVGLDYHYDLSPRDVQRAVLERQLLLACELGLPIILHNRDADTDTRQLLENAPDSLRGVLHCFMAERGFAEWASERGLYVGIGGPITFKSVRHLGQVVRHIPLDRLLIETDCPYLAPHPKRGRRNEPSFLPYVAERLADELGIPLQELARRTTDNACCLVGIG